MTGSDETEPQTAPQTGGPATLQRAQEAFEAGRFGDVRTLTAELVNDEDPEVARSAIELRRKTSIDPAQVSVLLVCLAFFVWVTWKYVF